jgi:hypothetical protein
MFAEVFVRAGGIWVHSDREFMPQFVAEAMPEVWAFVNFERHAGPALPAPQEDI